MGFGGTTKDSTKDTTYTPNPAVAGAATSNLNFVNNLRDSGFSPYGGNQVAQFGDLQQQSLDAAGNPSVANMIGGYAGAGAGSVNPGTISGSMSPYLNQYVNYALAPQIQAQQQQFDTQNRNLDAAATSSGAFGDSRAGIEAANLTNQQNTARQGLIGNAYNAAFNTAIGAGAQDVSNNLQGQTTNQNLRETALNRQLTGAGALQGNIGFQNTLGQQQTAQSQAQLNAQYNQWLMGQQRPFQTAELANQTIGAASHAMPANSTTTTSSPDNSGWGMVGSLAGTALGAFVGGPAGASIGGSLGSGLGNWFGGSTNYSGADNIAAGQGGGTGYSPNGAPMGNAYADGGQPPVGQPALVGERGPELFVPHQPGTIIPHEALANGGFAQAFHGKPTVSRPHALRKKSPLMVPKAANNNISSGAFGAQAA